MTVITPVTSQTTMSQPDEPTSRAMRAETMKIPDPIIDPATSMVESNRPSRCWKWGVPWGLCAGSSFIGLRVFRGAKASNPSANDAVGYTVGEINDQARKQPVNESLPGH